MNVRMNDKQKDSIIYLLMKAMFDRQPASLYVSKGGLSKGHYDCLKWKPATLKAGESFLVSVDTNSGREQHVINGDGDRDYLYCAPVDENFWAKMGTLTPPTPMILTGLMNDPATHEMGQAETHFLRTFLIKAIDKMIEAASAEALAPAS